MVVRFMPQLSFPITDILDESQPHLPWLIQSDLLVMEMPTSLSTEVLIGMDVLSNCKMLLDGPARRFTLDF